MLPRLLPEKGKYKSKRCKKMEQKKVIRDFKVLTEKISPDNVAVMAELIAMRETKALIGYYGYYAEKAHKNLCRDIFGKHEPGYIFSDSYDFVQSVALFLCDHFGEYLDDVLYISKKGKPRTIKIECYRIVTRMLQEATEPFADVNALNSRKKNLNSYMNSRPTKNRTTHTQMRSRHPLTLRKTWVLRLITAYRA